MHPACHASDQATRIDGIFFQSIDAQGYFWRSLRGLYTAGVSAKINGIKRIQSMDPVNPAGT
jgi:hypothetical protein